MFKNKVIEIVESLKSDIEHNLKSTPVSWFVMQKSGSDLLKEFRKSVNKDGLKVGSVLKHFGGISGYIKKESDPDELMYFIWDVTNPEMLNCFLNKKTFYIKIDEDEQFRKNINLAMLEAIYFENTKKE